MVVVHITYSLKNANGDSCKGHRTRCRVIADALMDFDERLAVGKDLEYGDYGHITLIGRKEGHDRILSVIDEPYINTSHPVRAGNWYKQTGLRVIDGSGWPMDESDLFLMPLPSSTYDAGEKVLMYPIIKEIESRDNVNVLLVPGSASERFLHKFSWSPNSVGVATARIAHGGDLSTYRDDLNWADVVVASCSNNALEAVAMGKHTLYVVTHKSQELLAQSLSAHGVKMFTESDFVSAIDLARYHKRQYAVIQNGAGDFVRELSRREVI